MDSIIERHIQMFLEERALNRKDSTEKTCMLRYVPQAYKILQEEERHEDILEFHALIVDFLLESYRNRGFSSNNQESKLDIFYKRFRDLLFRASEENEND